MPHCLQLRAACLPAADSTYMPPNRIVTHPFRARYCTASSVSVSVMRRSARRSTRRWARRRTICIRQRKNTRQDKHSVNQAEGQRCHSSAQTPAMRRLWQVSIADSQKGRHTAVHGQGKLECTCHNSFLQAIMTPADIYLTRITTVPSCSRQRSGACPHGSVFGLTWWIWFMRSGSKMMNSSRRLTNSGRKCPRTCSMTRARSACRAAVAVSPGVAEAASLTAAESLKISVLPRLEVMMMRVFLKLTVRP